MPNPPAPWEAEDAFPLKPVGSDYGYLTGRGPHACTHEELIARFSRRWRPRLVWTPESDRLVPPADVASLRPLLHQRQIRRARFVGVLAGILCVLHLPPLLTLRGEKLAVIAAELVLLGFIPFIWASRRLSVLRSTDPAEAPLARRNARFAAWLWGRRPVASWGFLACLGVTGVLQIVFGSDRVMDAAGFDRTMVKAGDWWRLITGSLVHINALHFIGNLVTIAVAGWLVEALTNRHHYAVLVLTACVAGGLASLPLYDYTVGASDVATGLIGSLALISWAARARLPSGFWKWIAWVAACELLGEIHQRDEVNHAAHAAGFIAGVLLGRAFLDEGLRPDSAWKRAGGVSAILIVVATMGVVASTVVGHRGMEGRYEEADGASEDGDYEGAERMYTAILELDPKAWIARYNRGIARRELNRFDAALEDFDAYVKGVPMDAEAHQVRGDLRAEMGDLDGALEDLNRAYSLESTADILANRAWVHWLRGEYAEGLHDAETAVQKDARNAYTISTRGKLRAAHGDSAGAMSDLSEAIRRESDHLYAYVDRGYLRHAMDDFKGAMEDFNRALEIDEEDADALLGRAVVWKAVGNAQSARVDLEDALKVSHRWWRKRGEVESELKLLPAKP